MRYMRIFKFLSAGAIGLGVNLGTYYVATQLLVHYLIGSAVAFLMALVVGFILQKYWTFEELSLERACTQFLLYGALALCNLAANTLIVYLLVENARTHYLVAQTIGAGLVACVSYFVYHFYIFSSSSQIDKTISE